MNTTLQKERIKEYTDGSLHFIKVSDAGELDVGATFDCGQAFRFDPVEGTRHEREFAGVAYGRAVSFANDGDTLYIYNATEREYCDLWRHYLGLHMDYDAIKRDIVSRSDKPMLQNAVSCGGGLRILSQEPWETVCSFIISQNNNIPRIKKIVASMSKRLGENIDISNMRGHLSEIMTDGCYAFPSAEAVKSAGVDVLSELRTGFRAKYIYDAASKVADGTIDFDSIRAYDGTKGAAEELMTVKGIGPKVAACSLLFGFERYDAFPIDVWIRRVMEKYFEKGFDPTSLGAYAGIAQQYLFYYERYFGGDNNG